MSLFLMITAGWPQGHFTIPSMASEGFSLGNPLFAFGVLGQDLASSSNLTFILGTIALVLLAVVVLGWLFVQRRLARQVELENALAEKANQLKSMQEAFSEMREDLNSAKKTVERKSRDLKMINHILDLKVERKTKELQEANTDLSTFLYRSSHDILGPMARLTGLCNLAQMEVSDPMALGYLAKLADTASELNQIIKNIQDVFEIKNRELVLGTGNLMDIVQEIIENDFEDELKGDVNIELKIEPELMVTTDLQLLRTVFSELIKNSLVHRSSYREGESRIEIDVQRKSKKLLVIVDDNGSGIPVELEEKIFDMFQRTSEMSKGTGMGLYIVKCALQRMRGNIVYKSKDDPGARFEMQIPNFQTA
ncbi:MAG TPA: hypothetical protein DCE41_36775 [Cytophagales bacterium]|nr:hypothetical protein [Cytophagales bacterium]HAA23355.1 hypothetical protein [Cytophagales bacterium]HAP65026.1 hypothetical protein [Cytophagales bacterium]